MTLARLLRPRSIATFGGEPAAEVIRQNDRIGFDGAIWPVHPSRQVIEGRPVFRSVAELPGAPDAVFLGLNRHLTVSVVHQLAASGAGGVVAYASGFSETGEAALQAQLRDAAGQMPVLGPNCYGFINYLDGVALWPDQHGGRPVPRGVAIVTQSGNIGLNMTMQRRGLPVACVITLGNQAVTGLSAVIEALLEDERISAIGLHIEAVEDPAAFVRAAAEARRRRVPIVALNTGSSQAGAALTVSHTASLASADAIFGAFLRKLGLARVTSLTLLLETLKLLHLFGPLPGAAIASMSCSGGEAALIADRAERRRLHFRTLDAAQAARVAATLPSLVRVSNPLDYHTFTWGNGPAMTATFRAMMQAEFDLTALVLDFPRLDRCTDTVWRVACDAFVAARRQTGARAAIITTLPEAMPEDRACALFAAGILPLLGIDDALGAIEAAAELGCVMVQEFAPPLMHLVPPGEVRSMDEWFSKQLLAEFGVAVPQGRLVHSPEEAVLAATDLGFPVVVKATGEHLVHKSEFGAVVLSLSDEAAVLHAAGAIGSIGDALLVERMVTDAVAELIVGVARDPRLGPYLLVGSGGILAELVLDRIIMAMPATRAEIASAVGRLRVAGLLDGQRGRPVGDTEAAIEAILAVQRCAIANIDRLFELDVNPVMVRPRGCGAVAVDAMIRLRRDAAHE